MTHFGLGSAELDYVEAEMTEVLQGIYALLHKAVWINDPFTTRVAHRKMRQLQVASDLGLRVPASIITNDGVAVFEFAEAVGWNLLIKSLGAISVTNNLGEESLQYGIFSRKVTKDELLAVSHTISNMPTLFQEYIDKDYELRVVCVGDRVFPCRIFSQELEAAREDYRFVTSSLSHEICDLPDDLNKKLLRYLHTFGLSFGCFDLAMSKSGEHVFFECNPNGQWLWIENMTGVLISKAIADLLGAAVAANIPGG
jgi:glutathione synthase/RimK-type ligase-like ATP-grasp enzyme